LELLVEKTRRNRAPAFKAMVASEAACEESTVAEISRRYGVHVNQVRAWKEQLFDGVVDVFASPSEGRREREDEVKDLHAKIGELTVERDLLPKVLKRYPRQSARPRSIPSTISPSPGSENC